MLKDVLKATLKNLISLTKNLDSALPSIEIKDATTHKLFAKIIFVENENRLFICESNDFYFAANDNFPNDIAEKININNKYRYIDNCFSISCVKVTKKTINSVLNTFNSIIFDYKDYCNKAAQKYFRLNEFEVSVSVSIVPTNYRRF